MKLVWYCKLCRSALKMQPAGALLRGCKCEKPVWPLVPTRVFSDA